MDKDGLGSGPQALGSGPQALAGEGPRVAHWRAAHGVRLDEDFAFAFCSLEEATRDAGPEVAVAWQQARARSAWLGGRSAQLLALLCPGGISRCRCMEGSASRRP